MGATFLLRHNRGAHNEIAHMFAKKLPKKRGMWYNTHSKGEVI